MANNSHRVTNVSNRAKADFTLWKRHRDMIADENIGDRSRHELEEGSNANRADNELRKLLGNRDSKRSNTNPRRYK